MRGKQDEGNKHQKQNKHILNIGCLNMRRGLFSKEHEVKTLIEQEKLDILFLLEALDFMTLVETLS